MAMRRQARRESLNVPYPIQAVFLEGHADDRVIIEDADGEEVFRALAPVLPGGLPTQFEPLNPGDPDLLLAMMDAAQTSSSLDRPR